MGSRRNLIIGGVVVVVAAGVGIAAMNNNNSDSKKNFSVAMVTDVGGVDDKSFNESAWNGVSEWGKSHDLQKGKNGYDYFASKTNADFATNFQQGVSAGYNMLIGVGYATNDALVASAKQNPKTDYVLIDDVAKKQYKNVASLTYKQQEASYLAGVAAATKAKELGDSKVGFIGGMNSVVIQSFEAGYIAGVKSVDPNMTVDAQFVESFTDTAKAKTIASAIYTSGAHVIFQAAGPAGNAVFTAAKDINTDLDFGSKDKAWVIGVDMDQNDQGNYKTKDGKSDNFTLTSAIKEIASSIVKVANQSMKGEFPGGKTVVYGLKDGGVAITKKNLDAEEKAAVEKAEEAIKSGEVTVPSTMK
ncbi:BMP family ABC transporter substrate-binding protein [Weissella confusa]|uniref:BMP family lipoprotein n=1 Tax=Weissella confusa TaxID=1583 RepID=UPI000E54C595|nr:BMP family protein [Weissella confusa]MBJ7676952.1 BMP family ABC transporter substrate-binding protein [Weissella confusa]MBJ7681590.1 BMP family ABC transporter substrate-binding protein [Weissella confusa]MBJ7683955.1 BMP family ABC transporter substrate-binding protein [Weissella confusa]MBJ7702549.1 BMP family ABC transporter substrate-binding protein [Weissella confusa]RGX47742.1 BMP family ABC transporter substrate-binding protein [Weissella confusa]